MNYSTPNGYSDDMPAVFAKGEYDTTVTLSSMRYYGGGGYVAVDVSSTYGETLHTVVNFDALAEFVDAVRDKARCDKIVEVEKALYTAHVAAEEAMHHVNDAETNKWHMMDSLTEAKDEVKNAEADLAAAEDAYQSALADYQEKLNTRYDLDTQLDDLLYGGDR